MKTSYYHLELCRVEGATGNGMRVGRPMPSKFHVGLIGEAS